MRNEKLPELKRIEFDDCTMTNYDWPDISQFAYHLWHVHIARNRERNRDRELWVTICCIELFTTAQGRGMGTGNFAMGFLPIFQDLKYFPVVLCNGFQLHT